MLSEQARRMIEANTDCGETLHEAYSALMVYLGCGRTKARPAEAGCNDADCSSGRGIFGHFDGPGASEMPPEDGETPKQ